MGGGGGPPGPKNARADFFVPALAGMTNREAEAHLKKGLDPPLCFSYFVYPIHLQCLVKCMQISAF